MLDLTSLYKIQYGMYVITTAHGNLKNGQIATVVFQVTNDPIQLAICLSKNTYTHELALQSNLLGISILAEETPTQFIGTFGYKCGRDCDKFKGVNFVIGAGGCPLITDNALVIMETEVKQILDLGSHDLFIAELVSSEKIRSGATMTYEYYHEHCKGKAPKNAPTFQSSA